MPGLTPACAAFSAMDAMERALAKGSPDFSAGVLEPGAPRASNGLPGVFGVLAEPKEAKAPEPKPKAFVADVVGEARLVPPGVVAEPKGFLFPCDESPPPGLFEKEPFRLESLPVEAEAP